MSEQTIAEKSLEIRQETQEFANTRVRVANVLDDINSTKANKPDVAQSLIDQNQNLQNHINDQANPHNVTKLQIGLGNVDNTSDLEKPISYVVETKLDDLEKKIGEDLLKKVDKTTTTITVPNAIFKYAYIFDDNNNVRRMLAGDLGKNVANSPLTSVAGAKLTLGANWEINTSGFYYYLKSLPDKSSDTNFTRFRLQDSNGQEAYASNIYNALFSSFNMFSAVQSLALSQLLNGGAGSGGAMSVNLISPPIVQNQYNSVEYVMLQGANLNLSAISRKIEILASDKTTVIATIPDNQIQIYDNGLSLVFYFNFYQFAEGQYFIKITSGSKVYITTLDLTIVPTVTDINIAGITWEKLYDPGVTPPSSDFAVGGNVIATSSTPQTNLPTTSFKSSELFAQGDDFYIELKIDLLDRTNGGTGYMPSFIGLGYSNSANNLVALSQAWFEYSWASGANFYLAQNNGNGIIYDGPARSFTVVFIKTGNLFRTVIGSSNVSKTLSNNSGYSLFMQLVGRPAPTQLSFQIIKAFKIN